MIYLISTLLFAFFKNLVKTSCKELHDLGLTRDQGFSIPEKLFRTEICLIPLLSIRVARANRSATEIPGDEPPRIGGERKLKVIKWGLAYLFQVFYEAAIDFRRNN